MTDKEEIRIEREFKAPRALVWRAWSDPEIFAEWYGPGVETIIHQYDFEVDGTLINEMRMGENSMFGVSIVKELIPEEKLVLHQSSSDAKGNITDNPMMPNWPRIMEAEVLFSDTENGTKMVFMWRPYDASDEEIAAFAQAAQGWGEQGWGKGFDIMEGLVAKM